MLPKPRLTERTVFTGATALLLLHAVDDAFLHPGMGVDAGQHALPAALALAAGLGAIALFDRVRPGLRALLAFVLAVPGLVNGGMHVAHVGMHGFGGADVTGIPAAAAAVTLLGLGFWIPWRHRGEGIASAAPRWAVRVLTVPAGLLALFFLAFPIGAAIRETHDFREPVGSPPDAAYVDAHFRSSDGLKLSGWYRPSRNGAAVMLMHGGGGTRRGTLRHAEMLTAKGYGVLVFDARGTGRSEGVRNGWGWGWQKDAAAALDYMEHRPDVRDGRIGALGLSSGADTLVDLAADHPELRAVVADGTALRTWEDVTRDRPMTVDSVATWLNFQAVQVVTGTKPVKPLELLARRIESPVLFISAGRMDEWRFSKRYARAAGPTAEHWNLPDATHTGAIRSHRAAYEQHVLAFFDRTL